MAAATADRDAKRSEGLLKAYGVAAATQIYKDTLVGVNAAGYLVAMSDTAGLTFVGVSFENVLGTTNGTKACRVRSEGEYDVLYSSSDAAQAIVGSLVYMVDSQSVNATRTLVTNVYQVGRVTEVTSTTHVRVKISIGPSTGDINTARLSANARGRVELIAIEDLTAGVNLAARAEFVAPVGGAVITRIGIVPADVPAGINDANPCVVTVAGPGGTLATKTFNTANPPPAVNTYASLGALTAANAALTANQIVTVAVTQGATSDIEGFRLVIEWDPAA